MYAKSATLAVGLLSALSALGAPASEIVERASITTYTSAQVAAFKPFTWYASAGHCPASQTIGWTCGSEFLFPITDLRNTF